MACSNLLELIFSSQDKEILMNKTSEFRIISIDGLESSSYSIKNIDSNTDGADVTYRKIEPREITIVGDVKKNCNEDINRRILINFFNPKVDGILSVTRNDDKKKISYVVSSFRFLNTKMSDFLQFEIILECPNPYFESIDNYGKDIANVTKQFAFPLAIVQNKGKIMGYKTYNNNATLDNDGDCETGCEIHIKALGNVVNPKIVLNDKYILVNTTMNINDELVINTNQRKKSVKLNGVNIIQRIDRNSSFFNLAVGSNIMSYESTEGYENMEVNIYYSKKYLGV